MTMLDIVDRQLLSEERGRERQKGMRRSIGLGEVEMAWSNVPIQLGRFRNIVLIVNFAMEFKSK
jgi:hypothetical protein